MRLAALAVLALGLAIVGCNETQPSGAIPGPEYDPGAMADAAIRQFDRNGNGTIEGAELDGCPALKQALERIDTNKDQSISSDELRARVQSYKSLGGTMSVVVDVKMGGRPLAGAVVTFVPEDSMKGALKGGNGTSNGAGLAQITGPGGAPGLACGLYKITVSKKGADGKESLPAKYNTTTTLGREISADPRSGDSNIHLDLK